MEYAQPFKKKKKIVSASGFTGASRLYTEYALCLPRHWVMAAEEGGGIGGERRGRAASVGEDHGGDAGEMGGIGGQSEEFAAGGTTQVKCDVRRHGVCAGFE